MKQKIFSAFVATLLVLGGCTQNVGDINTNDNTNFSEEEGTSLGQENGEDKEIVVEEEEGQADGDQAGKEQKEGDKEGDKEEEEALPSAGFVSYTNKAVGYTISRPDKWYWRHYIRSEIGEKNPKVHDYFITDKSPLTGLGSQHLGTIVIEVSENQPEDFADTVKDLNKRNVQVAGLDATRYEGIRRVGDVNWDTVEYHFVKEAKTFRLLYAMQEGPGDYKEVFEELVKSFTFDVTD